MIKFKTFCKILQNVSSEKITFLEILKNTWVLGRNARPLVNLKKNAENMYLDAKIGADPAENEPRKK